MVGASGLVRILLINAPKMPEYSTHEPSSSLAPGPLLLVVRVRATESLCDIER